MKWKTNTVGDTRVITKFAFFPISCRLKHKQNKTEKRWLEFVTIEQMWLCGIWNDIYFIDIKN